MRRGPRAVPESFFWFCEVAAAGCDIVCGASLFSAAFLSDVNSIVACSGLDESLQPAANQEIATQITTAERERAMTCSFASEGRPAESSNEEWKGPPAARRGNPTRAYALDAGGREKIPALRQQISIFVRREASDRTCSARVRGKNRGRPCRHGENSLFSEGVIADVAELADAQVSGTCSLTGVEVRSLSSAFCLDATVRAAEGCTAPSAASVLAGGIILGVVLLGLASGVGAEMRQTLGTAVFSGMIGVTLFAIFLRPVFQCASEWFGDRQGPHESATEPTRAFSDSWLRSRK